MPPRIQLASWPPGHTQGQPGVPAVPQEKPNSPQRGQEVNEGLVTTMDSDVSPHQRVRALGQGLPVHLAHDHHGGHLWHHPGTAGNLGSPGCSFHCKTKPKTVLGPAIPQENNRPQNSGVVFPTPVTPPLMPPRQVSSMRHQKFQKLRDTEGSKPHQDYLGAAKASHNLQFHKPVPEHKTQLNRRS